MSGQSPSAGPPLPIAETAQRIFGLLWRQRDHLLRLGLVPASVSFVLALLVVDVEDQMTLVLGILFNLAPITVFAVAWHRVVLLGPETVPGLGLQWKREHVSYLGYMLLLLIVMLAVSLLPTLLLGRLMMRPAGAPILILLALGLLYLTLRLSLVLPAAALGRPLTLSQSWRATGAAGVAMLAVTLVTILPILLGVMIFMMFAGGTGLEALAPYSVLFLVHLADYVGGAAGVTLMALAYRALVGVGPRIGGTV